MNKAVKTTLIIGISVIIAVLVFYPKLKPLINPIPDDPGALPGGQRGPMALNVDAVIIGSQSLSELINSTGTLIADEEVDLSFETSGKITTIYFNEGTQVSKGDLLAKINDRHLQAQLLKLKAQKKLAEEKEFRQRTLLTRDAISRESYDQIVTELETLEADIMLIEARIAETELRAPFDGIIGLRYLSEGAYANPNAKIARLIKNRPIKIEFSIPERYSGEVRKGFPISFRIDGIPNPLQASVYAVDPKVDVRTRTVIVRALYPNQNEELKPGRFAAITLELTQFNDAIAIPTESLIPEMEGDRIFVYRSGRATPVFVRTGIRTESQIQIIEGLNQGDTLIATGVMQLRPGMPVVIDNILQQ
jgi:membrane fusion protein, multidrug efflux system